MKLYIEFTCPSCGQSIEAPVEGAGKSVMCPTCQGSVTIPFPMEPSPFALSPTRNRWALRPGIIAVAVIALLSISYLASPYWALQQLVGSLKRGDAEGVSSRVDFPSLRESLKSQLTSTFVKRLQDDPDLKENPFAGLAFIAGPKIVEMAVESYVSPAGLAVLLANHPGTNVGPHAGANPAKQPEEQPRISRAFFTGISSFGFSISEMRGTMRLTGLSWKLCNLQIPAHALDDIAQTPKTAATPPVPEPESQWNLSHEKSPMNDMDVFVLSREATEADIQASLWGKPTLIVRLKEGKLDVYINFGRFLGSDSIAVEYRLDKSPPVQIPFALSTDGKAVFMPSDSKEWLDWLLKSTNLVVRVTPHLSAPIMAQFDLSGMRESAEPLLKAIPK